MILLSFVAFAHASDCSPGERTVVTMLPPGTTAAVAESVPDCLSPIQKLVPVRVLDGTSTLLFALGHPHDLADTAFLVPGAVPAASPIGTTTFGNEAAHFLPVYVDGVRLLRRGMLY